MNIARELLLYLETKTSHVVGTDMFMGVYPVGNETGILIYDTGGTENDTNLKASNIHIAVQYDDYDTANDTIHSLWDVLAYSKGITLGNGVYLFNTTPLKYPGFVTTTGHDKYLFTCSIIAYFE